MSNYRVYNIHEVVLWMFHKIILNSKWGNMTVVPSLGAKTCMHREAGAV